MNCEDKIISEIFNTVEKLPISMQIKVKEYAHVLQNSIPKSGNAYKLKKHFGVIDDNSAEEMNKAIEEGCEKIDVENW